MTAAAAARMVRTMIVVLPERPIGLNLQTLENRIRVACERQGINVTAVHYCGQRGPTLLASKLKLVDQVAIFSPQLERFEIVPADVLARLLGDREI